MQCVQVVFLAVSGKLLGDVVRTSPHISKQVCERLSDVRQRRNVCDRLIDVRQRREGLW